MDIKEAVRDIIPWDGTLSSSDFFLAAHAFSEKWKRFNPYVPPWLWVPCPKHHLASSHQVEGYLSLENMCFIKSSEEQESNRSLTSKEGSNISQGEEQFDYATLVPDNCHEVNHYDFHIVYSSSYRVPVLYFRAYHSDGQPLSLNDIEKDLPGNSSKLLSQSKWTFITNEEHPYLNRPWYKLHPCATSDWMKLLFLGDTSFNRNGFVIEQYMDSWFSVIGQVVGLKIPLGMVDTIVANHSWRGVAMETSSRRQKNSSDGAYTLSSNPSTPIDGSEYEAPQLSVRPPGQNATKRKAKAKVATVLSNNDDLAAAEAVAKGITKAMEDANLIRFHEILTKDTSQMTEAQLQWHNLICDKIMSKLA